MNGQYAQRPTVSIVIPTYNRGAMLQEAVESCLNQTFSDVEVIIVDDGSTDGTDAMVAGRREDSWARGHIRYVRQQNQGASSARNHGLSVAAGEYVQFLDSDDLLGASKIARQLEAMQDEANRNASCCLCFGRMMSRAEGGVASAGRRIGVRGDSPAGMIRQLCTRQVHVMQTAAPLWRREFLVGRSGWREDISLGDDLEYHARLLAEASGICFVDDELFVVREHEGDRLSVVRPTVSAVASQLKARRSVHESARRAGVWDEYNQWAFLGAMRTVYANALETRNAELIAELERWLWELASAPKSRLAFKAMIAARRVLGGPFLLSAHRLVQRLRAA
jgi:glycosyltransferase involved in cell wall biosynthesis